MDFLRLLLSTLLLRPYVFIFLAVYLLLALPAWGWKRTLIYTLLGYGLAWTAEYSSIHNGFPFGLYSYIQEPTADLELWVAGVPFMDSLSFVFLTFTGLHMSRLVFERIRVGPKGDWDLRWVSQDHPIRIHTWLLAGLFTMGLDIVIDPLTLCGQRWFLGQIYTYAQHGRYFGVPLSNFIGWALLAWTILGVFALLENKLLVHWLGAWRSYPADALWGALLYAGILVFNLTITFIIGETLLGFMSIAISLLLLSPLLARLYGNIPITTPE